jgi:hypothetical protein
MKGFMRDGMTGVDDGITVITLVIVSFELHK